MIQRGGCFSKNGLTGPSTPSALYLLHVSNNVSNQFLSGNSSSSMHATYSHVAFANARFRASAIFCSGSTQYSTSKDTRLPSCSNTCRADSLESLSHTTTENVNCFPVSC